MTRDLPAQALAAAIRTGQLTPVRQVLDRHPELRGPTLDLALPDDPFGATPLLAAIRSGNREMVDLLLHSGADIHQRSHWWAGGFGVLDEDRRWAPFLIERGALVDAHAAARLGMADRLRALIAADPGVVHARGGDGQTPLHMATTPEIAGLLLDHGAEIDTLDVDHESTPAQYLVRDHPDVARYLVGRDCRTDLLLCAALGERERVRRHLDADPACIHMAVNETWFPKRNPHSGGTIYLWKLGHDKTAHLIAREFGHEEVFALLMERTPPDLELALACELGDEGAFRRLLAGRPDLASTLSPVERRKLADAARANNAGAVRLMLAAGWPLDARGDLGGTALHHAAWAGNFPMTRELLLKGAPLELPDTTWGRTPVEWALHGSIHSWHKGGNHAAVVEAMLGAGAKRPGLSDGLEASDAVLEVLRRTR